MRRHVLDQRTALALANISRQAKPQQVTRIGAFTLGPAKKAALGTDAHRRYAVKSNPTKSLAPSDRAETVGVTRPLQSLAGWRCRYTRLMPRPSFDGQMRPRQTNRSTVGAPADPRYGCAVITVESASGLVRLRLRGLFPCRWPERVGKLCLGEKA